MTPSVFRRAAHDDAGSSRGVVRRSWPVLAGAAVLLAVSSTGGAVAGSMVTGERIKNFTISQKDLRTGAVDSRTIADGGVQTKDLSAATVAALRSQAAATGASWLSGTGAPGARAARNGDCYLDTSASDVYTRTNGAWVLTVNLRGPAGPAGSNGTNGANGANGAAGTSGANGANGAAGADGATWTTGGGLPTGGADGDLYLRTTTGEVFQRSAGTWGSPVANLRGAAGTNGTNGQGVPTGGTAGQVLSKVNGSDFSTQWVTPARATVVVEAASNADTSIQVGSGRGIDFNSISTNVGNQFTGLDFTAASAGIYQVQAQAGRDAASNQEALRLFARQYRSGSTLRDTFGDYSSEGFSNEVTAGLAVTVPMQQGDTLRINGEAFGAGGNSFTVDGAPSTYLTIVKLG